VLNERIDFANGQVGAIGKQRDDFLILFEVEVAMRIAMVFFACGVHALLRYVDVVNLGVDVKQQFGKPFAELHAIDFLKVFAALLYAVLDVFAERFDFKPTVLRHTHTSK
jgi:hypothetical protein